MLILTRRVGEKVVIDRDILVTVLGFHGNQIRLGVTAPRSITVDREEIHESKLRGEKIRTEEVPNIIAAIDRANEE